MAVYGRWTALAAERGTPLAGVLFAGLATPRVLLQLSFDFGGDGRRWAGDS